MKVGPSIAALGVITSASWVVRAQAPEEAPPMTAPRPPPPIYQYPQPPTTGMPGSEATTVAAEPGVIVQKGIPAPRDALELSFGTGYTQGFGSLRGNVGLPSVATAGVGFNFGLGYRINAHWAVLWTGEYEEFTAERSDIVDGITNTVGAQYHLAPTNKIDPWAELGAGYRYLWESSRYAPSVGWHGFQLVHLRVGIDFRADPVTAIGPVIGADATMFQYEDLPYYYTAHINDTRLSTFVYAGLQGRFDIGGHTPAVYQTYARQ
jgi:hypothetical protein